MGHSKRNGSSSGVNTSLRWLTILAARRTLAVASLPGKKSPLARYTTSSNKPTDTACTLVRAKNPRPAPGFSTGTGARFRPDLGNRLPTGSSSLHRQFVLRPEKAENQTAVKQVKGVQACGLNGEHRPTPSVEESQKIGVQSHEQDR